MISLLLTALILVPVTEMRHPYAHMYVHTIRIDIIQNTWLLSSSIMFKHIGRLYGGQNALCV